MALYMYVGLSPQITDSLPIEQLYKKAKQEVEGSIVFYWAEGTFLHKWCGISKLTK